MRISLITADQVAGMCCPHCGRPMPRDQVQTAAARDRWGFVGAAAWVDERLVGLFLVSSAEGSAGASLAVGWVVADHQRQGVGKAVLRHLAAALLSRGVKTLMAASGSGRGCAGFPAGWLVACGFRPINRPHRWRLDLNRAVLAKRSLREALVQLIPVVTPVPPPEPVGRTGVR